MCIHKYVYICCVYHCVHHRCCSDIWNRVYNIFYSRNTYKVEASHSGIGSTRLVSWSRHVCVENGTPSKSPSSYYFTLHIISLGILYSLILGFLDKREAHEMLLRCQPGTFIVRFTESEPGGVSIVWVKSKCGCMLCSLSMICHYQYLPACLSVSACLSAVSIAMSVNIHSTYTPQYIVIITPPGSIEKQVYDLAPWNRSSLQGMRSFADR